METRYHYGGDEFTFIDFDIEMSLEVNFKVSSPYARRSSTRRP